MTKTKCICHTIGLRGTPIGTTCEAHNPRPVEEIKAEYRRVILELGEASARLALEQAKIAALQKKALELHAEANKVAEATANTGKET